jgi:hypothetical protein
MGSKLSFQPVLKDETIQEMDGTSQLLMLPREVLSGILKFLDGKTLALAIPRVCKHFYRFCGLYSEEQHFLMGYLGHIYEMLIFPRGDSVSGPTPPGGFQPLYFRPNVNLPFMWLKKPAGVRIDVIITSTSKEIRLNEISSMIMSLYTSKNASETVRKEASQFLAQLFAIGGFDNLKNLKLFGFHMDDSSWSPLLNLSLDWLHLTSHSISGFIPDPQLSWKFKRLHLKLENGCTIPICSCIAPSPLEELFLHFSDQEFPTEFDIPDCKNLKKM